jgi:molybdate transport system ATP-binding protein
VDACVEFQCEHRYASGFRLQAQFSAGRGITALVGPSGSGKSTVLSLIAGLIQPHCGRIVLDGEVITDVPAKVFVPPQARGIGMVFQDNSLFPHLTVRANIEYSLRRRPGPRLSVTDVVQTLQLGDVWRRYPRSLSGGQQQRTALARALLSARRLLLLDEPLTAVEPELRDRSAALIRQFVDEFQVPALLVTHHVELVDRLATRVLQLRAGQIVDGEPNFNPS